MQIIDLLDVILRLLLKVTQQFTHAIFVFRLLFEINGFGQIGPWISILISLLLIDLKVTVLGIKCLELVFILDNFFSVILLKLIYNVLVFHLFSI